MSDATQGASGSIARLVAGAMDGPGHEAERATLLARLTALRDTYRVSARCWVTSEELCGRGGGCEARAWGVGREVWGVGRGRGRGH